MKVLRKGAAKRALRFVLFGVVATTMLALPLASSNAASPGAGTVSDSNRRSPGRARLRSPPRAAAAGRATRPATTRGLM